jgi:hypothetical protein
VRENSHGSQDVSQELDRYRRRIAAAGLLGNQSKAQGRPPRNMLFILVDELQTADRMR